ncbi:hypothetical protein RND81_09G069600 [Saponaria officinalis]|uniref:Uncharacterized protein n=1 Tax=Saponaria officinalis TaxID=3572 RepID=A0AAW1III3_SAPOF
MHIFTGHTGEVYGVACSPVDTTLVATTLVAIEGGDDKGFMWRIGQGDWAFELQGHSDSINTLGFSMDGQLLASESFDGTVRVRNVASQSLKYTLDGPDAGIEDNFNVMKTQLKELGTQVNEEEPFYKEGQINYKEGTNCAYPYHWRSVRELLRLFFVALCGSYTV